MIVFLIFLFAVAIFGFVEVAASIFAFLLWAIDP